MNRVRCGDLGGDIKHLPEMQNVTSQMWSPTRVTPTFCTAIT